MATDLDIRLLTSPRIFLVGMAAFLALVGFVVLILYKQIALAFSANPGLNGLILGVLAIGSLFTFRQVIRLFREIHWVNSLTGAHPGRTVRLCPLLLAPMAAMLHAGGERAASRPSRRAPYWIPSPPDSTRDANLAAIWSAFWFSSACSARSGAYWRRSIRSAGVIESMKTGCRYGHHVRRPQARSLRADRRHERLVHVLAVRPRQLADPRLPRPPGRPGAKSVLFRIRGISRRPS